MPLRLKKMARVPRGEEYDVVIVGGGPAGISAAIYASRFLLKTVIVTIDVGGQLNLTDWVDDYPGLGKIRASDLVANFRSHAEYFNVNIVEGVKVSSISREGDMFTVKGSRGLLLKSKTVILTVGSQRRKLGVPGEKELAGKGVSYCSVCDAPFFKGKNAVAVVGGGDSALEGALLLSGYVGKVYLIHRRDQFRAKPFYVEQAKAKPNIEMILNSVVEEIRGRGKVESVIVKNKITGELTELDVDGIFIEIGFEPPREWFKSLGLDVDEQGYIKVNEWMETNIPGLYAAGDCTNLWLGFRQIVTAAAMGAVAAYSAYNYLVEKGLYKPVKPVIIEEKVG